MQEEQWGPHKGNNDLPSLPSLMLSGAEPKCWGMKQSFVQQDTANTEKVSFVAALLTTDRRVTGQSRVLAFCTALFSWSVWVHSVQERISQLKRPKHCASQSLLRKTVKKNPDLTHQRKMTKQTLAVLETTTQATSMTKLRLQPEQESH